MAIVCTDDLIRYVTNSKVRYEVVSNSIQFHIEQIQIRHEQVYIRYDFNFVRDDTSRNSNESL